MDGIGGGDGTIGGYGPGKAKGLYGCMGGALGKSKGLLYGCIDGTLGYDEKCGVGRLACEGME